VTAPFGPRARALLAGLICLIGGAGSAQAQTRWVVDPKSSLAWWQVSPHLNHLWATSCPQDPAWRPGEGRSSGWAFDKLLKLPRTGYANDPDTIHVPLYPRREVKPICAEAVRGQVQLPDTLRWKGAHGVVAVRAEGVITGENMRDAFAHRAVLQTQTYPEIQFTIDSLVGMSRQADTIRGTAMGTLTMHGMTKPLTGVVTAFRDAGGMRVLAKLHLPAQSLLDDWGFSKFGLSLGVGTGIWQDLFMGVDMLLRVEGATGN
jgi:hypothetical protein